MSILRLRVPKVSHCRVPFPFRPTRGPSLNYSVLQLFWPPLSRSLWARFMHAAGQQAG
jgi:hypothetical protein